MKLNPPTNERDFWLMFTSGRQCSAPPDRTYTIMSPAKTNAQRQAGLVALRNVWVHPDDAPEMREHAGKLARRREKLAKRERPNVQGEAPSTARTTTGETR